MNFGEKPRKRVTINITSLVDILIVLLLFFMLTTQFIHMDALHLSVSDPAGAPPNQENKIPAIIITLTGAGKFMIDDKKFDLLQLKEKIKPLLDSTKGNNITLITKKGVIVQEIVTAIDYIKAAGGKNISLSEDIDDSRK